MSKGVQRDTPVQRFPRGNSLDLYLRVTGWHSQLGFTQKASVSAEGIKGALCRCLSLVPASRAQPGCRRKLDEPQGSRKAQRATRRPLGHPVLPSFIPVFGKVLHKGGATRSDLGGV